MNPRRQRRGVLLVILALIGAIVVFMSVLGYVARVESTVASMKETWPVFQLKAGVRAKQPITEAQLQQVQLPRRYVTGAFVRDISEVNQKVAAGDIPAGAYLERGMLVDNPYLRPNQREIAILIDAETGVAGKVRPGNKVDIYATFQQQNAVNQQPCALRVVANVPVIQIGQIQTQGADQDLKRVVPVTFALEGTQSLELTYYESFANKLRLALRGDQDVGEQKLPSICRVGGGR
jgi:pilus assembly protein CpaB